MFNKNTEKIGDLENKIKRLEEVIGKESFNWDYLILRCLSFGPQSMKNEPTLIQRIESLEKFLNIKWVTEKTEFKGYKEQEKDPVKDLVVKFKKTKKKLKNKKNDYRSNSKNR